MTLPTGLQGIEEIDACAFYGCPKFIIHKIAETYAEQSAKEQGLSFVEFSDI